MAMLGRIELLFDDLLDTNNWMLRERAREPLGLIVLGTSGQYNTSDQSEMEAAMQNARYESGQDNSPMCKASRTLIAPLLTPIRSDTALGRGRR